ncbi:MAG: NUDIX hydrolase [bacterium]
MTIELDADVRPAATVLLLRDAGAGIETWLLRRVTGMAFAGGMSVFPGGQVDPSDAHPDMPWSGPSPAPPLRAVTVAAVRETFEETGVLLSRPAASGAVLARRAEVEARTVEFAALLREADLGIDAALVRPWARWITPVGEPRRYDTWFFVAALPADGGAAAVSTEAAEAGWITPGRAVEEHRAGIRGMLPPTLVALQEMAGFSTVSAVLAAAGNRDLGPVQPVLEPESGRVRLPDGRVLSVLRP